MEPINKRYEKRETKREAKALLAAKLENAIEKELLNRLQAGTYKDIYNLKQEDFNKALDEEEIVADEYEVDVSEEEDDDSVIGGDLEDGESEMGEDELAELEAE
jgi:protein MAK16